MKKQARIHAMALAMAAFSGSHMDKLNHANMQVSRQIHYELIQGKFAFWSGRLGGKKSTKKSNKNHISRLQRRKRRRLHQNKN